MIILYFHPQPQFKYELFHILHINNNNDNKGEGDLNERAGIRNFLPLKRNDVLEGGRGGTLLTEDLQ